MNVCLNNKERMYIGIYQVSHDREQARGGGITPTDNIIRWMCVRNTKYGDVIQPDSQILNFRKELSNKGIKLEDFVNRIYFGDVKTPTY